MRATAGTVWRERCVPCRAHTARDCDAERQDVNAYKVTLSASDSRHKTRCAAHRAKDLP